MGVWLNVDYTIFALPVYNLQANFLENLHLHLLHYLFWKKCKNLQSKSEKMKNLQFLSFISKFDLTDLHINQVLSLQSTLNGIRKKVRVEKSSNKLKKLIFKEHNNHLVDFVFLFKIGFWYLIFKEIQCEHNFSFTQTFILYALWHYEGQQ